jgi:DNA polymerase III alpha subunit
MEDERGLVNVIVFPQLYEEQRLLVRSEPFLVVEGRLQSRHGTINVIATRLHTLEMARQAFINAPARDFIIGSRPLHPPAKIEERRSLREITPAAHDFR